ncbi:SDR family NAD(P)-dependent oxidoreductase [Viridibacillus sp. YIM B01967]|uniref:SDR family NAD(P)-dependent oxidoreductase n=1 Tax=Viridibacillus soli TaxID=2798301 RepID=A0ABS1H6Z0_9BACL|nr:SDR family NAD(P)-dependent oxidoreductase [Viridibacillus soli]MBK3495188.1 SDR family NAD(P)-dependent oxidoreductase [Viridibacillus soli]
MLTGKVALITGSTRGIGKSIALQMAKEGALVAVNGTNANSVQIVVDEIHSIGGHAMGICESVATIAGAEYIVSKTLTHFGKIDILINNAGITRDQLLVNMSDQAWQEVLDVHLTGTFACTRAVVQHMKTRDEGGCLINMTSTAGLMGTVGQVNYSAVKAGILGLTWTLAEELKRFSIRVNAIAPAALTDMTQPVIERIQAKCEAESKPFPDFWKVGSPEDVAKVVVLIADDSSTVSGQVFSVNGSKIGKWEKPSHAELTLEELKDIVCREN